MANLKVCAGNKSTSWKDHLRITPPRSDSFSCATRPKLPVAEKTWKHRPWKRPSEVFVEIFSESARQKVLPTCGWAVVKPEMKIRMFFGFHPKKNNPKQAGESFALPKNKKKCRLVGEMMMRVGGIVAPYTGTLPASISCKLFSFLCFVAALASLQLPDQPFESSHDADIFNESVEPSNSGAKKR